MNEKILFINKNDIVMFDKLESIGGFIFVYFKDIHTCSLNCEYRKIEYIGKFNSRYNFMVEDIYEKRL